MKAEDDCKVERKHTLKLRHAMEQRPSQELMWELQQEKDLLQARVQELEVSVQVGLPAVHTRLHFCGGASSWAHQVVQLQWPGLLPSTHLQEGKLDRNSPYIQVLEEDWRQALKEHQEQANTIFSLRKDLRQAEALRTRVRDQGRQAMPTGYAKGGVWDLPHYLPFANSWGTVASCPQLGSPFGLQCDQWWLRPWSQTKLAGCGLGLQRPSHHPS